ncbi:MAG: amidohydrolase family protein, partial [Pyrinomonadaceae bacterium]
VELCATNPARILKLEDRGAFRPGSRADVTILDPEMTWTFDVSRSASRSRNTPFNGRTMTGAAVATIVAGRVVFLHPDFSRLNTSPRETLASAANTRK